MKFKNNAARITVSVIAIPLILAACYFGKIYFLVFSGLVALAAFNEFGKMVKHKPAEVNFFLGHIFVILIMLNSYFNFIENMFAVFAAYVVLLSIFELFRHKGSAINNIGATLLSSLYIGLFTAALVAIRQNTAFESDYSKGGLLIISMFASIWACDSAAYYFGSAFGKHKLFPRVSPNKSWEGSIAGFIFAIVMMIAAKTIVLDISWAGVIIIGLITGIFGQVGDLIESLFKRDAKVKDSSHMIPGHGGIFDRFDSILFSAPLVYLYLQFFEKMI
ncbi:MAG: phosphatidate cytidylyltransferase [Bacteroidota bacterium]|nr:phosphatidate cytidylyltransferase [Bacteroidota bacterium]